MDDRFYKVLGRANDLAKSAQKSSDENLRGRELAQLIGTLETALEMIRPQDYQDPERGFFRKLID